MNRNTKSDGHQSQAMPSPGDESASPDRPRYSIVIPAYNEELFLGSCLDALAGQDYAGPFEIIVVDNNSTDGTADIGRAHGASVIHEQRPGVCSARQAGTLAARGDVIISTDADTVFHPNWLSRIDRTLTARPDCVAVAGPCQFQNAPRWAGIYTWLVFHTVDLINKRTGRVIYASATNIAFRKNAWTSYDTAASQGGDEWGLLRQLRPHGPIAFDLSNPTLTSSRRLHRGLAYTLLVTCLYYYLLAYPLNRLFGKTVIGTAPPMRHDPRTGPPTPTRRTRARARVVAITITIIAWIAVVGLVVHLPGQ